MSFRWIPGQGADTAAIERLKKNFPKPQKPPPQAWFMGEKNDPFSGLDETVRSFEKEDFEYLKYALEDIGGGINWFKMRLPEWIDWFHYLLPYIVVRPDVDRLIGAAITYLMNLYPDGIPDIYPEFRQDVVNTLGKCLMSSHLWRDDDLADKILEDEYIHWALYNNNMFIETLSPALFCCLKYLSADEMVTWVDSLALIPGRHWHYHLLTWLHRAVIILEDYGAVLNPVESIQSLSLGWFEASRLQFFKPYEFIPKINMDIFVQDIRRHRLLMIAPLPPP